MVDKHGLKMIGLKAVASDTKWAMLGRSGCYLELFYNKKTGRVWTIEQCSLGHNTWTVYEDKAVIKIGNIESRLSMQKIADTIHTAITEDW